MAAVQSAITGAIQTMENAVVNKFTDIGNLIGNQLTAGFTQQSNYTKAAVGAQEQIADASNTAMATYQKDIRNAQLRDEHTMSPEACTALNMGQAITVSAGQSWRVGQALGAVTDPRGEAGPGTPANAGQGQAAAAITQLHLSRYCSQNEASAGLCTVNAPRENLDQRASSLFGAPNYAGQDGVDAANDYATSLIQPVPPAAARGDALTSVAGSGCPGTSSRLQRQDVACPQRGERHHRQPHQLGDADRRAEAAADQHGADRDGHLVLVWHPRAGGLSPGRRGRLGCSPCRP